jgi:hypothetical protein
MAEYARVLRFEREILRQLTEKEHQVASLKLELEYVVRMFPGSIFSSDVERIKKLLGELK